MEQTMMKKTTAHCLLFTAFCFFCCLPMRAQSDILSRLEQQRTGEGVVTVTQDTRLSNLLTAAALAAAAEEHTMKVAGYRVQVYAGNNSGTARTEANAMAEKVKHLFPTLSVYTNFISPRWICRVGDFRSIEEADAIMRQLKEVGSFKERSIVKQQINVTY